MERKGLGANAGVPGYGEKYGNRYDLFGVMRSEGVLDAYPKGDKDDLLKNGHRGDAWYAKKGLACFEELAVQKSTRKGLYDVLQPGETRGDSGNLAGRNAGDSWLDTKLKNPVFTVDGLKFGSRYSGDADGDLYGQLSHTHRLSEHPTRVIVDPPDPVYDRMQRLNAALDEDPRSKRRVDRRGAHL